MPIRGRRIVVTGGAGLVGSWLAERLCESNDVVVVDDLSNGHREWVPPDVTFVEASLLNRDTVDELITDDVDIVFHLAASKHVNTDTPRRQFENNLAMTYNILERMEGTGVKNIGFTSSSTVYGEAPQPTPEDFAPLEPISPYAAAKVGEEGLLSVYADTYDFTVWNYRFANVVGPRLRNAVIPDFIEKLLNDPERLVILGDGRQEKSFMHVQECIDAMLHIVEHGTESMNTYNLGTRTTTSIRRVADIVSDEMGVTPSYEYTGGERGWKGDVPRMRLSIEKLSALGWEPNQSSDEAVRQTATEILAEIQ